MTLAHVEIAMFCWRIHGAITTHYGFFGWFVDRAFNSRYLLQVGVPRLVGCPKRSTVSRLDDWLLFKCVAYAILRTRGKSYFLFARASIIFVYFRRQVHWISGWLRRTCLHRHVVFELVVHLHNLHLKRLQLLVNGQYIVKDGCI